MRGVALVAPEDPDRFRRVDALPSLRDTHARRVPALRARWARVAAGPALMLGLAVLGTAGPSPISLEGRTFTLRLPIHLVGLPEEVVQRGLFAAVVARRWR